MKKILLTLLAVATLVGIIAGLGFGSAAAVNINDTTLGAGTAAVTNGATGDITVTYETNLAGPSTDHPNGGFGVWGVDLNNLAPGEHVLVSLMDDAAIPNILAFFEGTADASGNAVCIYHYSGGGWVTGFACWADEVYNVDIVTKSDWAPGDGNPPLNP